LVKALDELDGRAGDGRQHVQEEVRGGGGQDALVQEGELRGGRVRGGEEEAWRGRGGMEAGE
jgi:hypothetical protein